MGKFAILKDNTITGIILAEKEWLDQNDFNYVEYTDGNIGDQIINGEIIRCQRPIEIPEKAINVSFKIVLIRKGLMPQVELYLNSNPELKIWFDSIDYFYRNSERLLQAKSDLNVTDDLYNQIFIEAQSIN